MNFNISINFLTIFGMALLAMKIIVPERLYNTYCGIGMDADLLFANFQIYDGHAQHIALACAG